MNVPAVSITTQASVKPARPVKASFTVVSTEPHIAAFWCSARGEPSLRVLSALCS